MRINFKELPIRDIEGRLIPTDVAKTVGNVLFNLSEDVAEWQLGVDIYHSNGEMDLTDDEVAILRKFSNRFLYVLRSSILEVIGDGVLNRNA